VHGFGGIDELSPAGPNLVCEVVDGGVRRLEVDPQALGLRRCAPEQLRGGSPGENAAVIRAVFTGEEQGPKRDAILLNAAGAIAAGGHAEDLREGLDVAQRTVDSGAAAERLEALAAFSHHG
jgi:anthranilate phosphoribosyltransferase